MIIKTNLPNDLIERKSDKGVYILNTTTGNEYAVAVDLENERRIELGLPPMVYEETEKPIKDEE